MPENQIEPLASSLTLVRQAKEGDTEALDALFRRYASRVLHIARVRLGPGLRTRLDSQDIVQEAFIRAVKGFGKFEVRHEGAFLHWMSELVRNAIRDQYDYFHAKKRAMSRDVALIRPTDLTDHGAATVPGFDPTPSRVFAAREDIQKLVDAMDRLPEEAREAVVQRDMEGLPFAEIGKMMGRSEDAARMLYARAKAKLAALMQAS
ncbi:MAG: sigma-70 family RNA polymerase sigma factor [Elusimicrobiota bacterium]